MKLYDIRVRLQGTGINHEIAKSGVTASEIKLLKAIHGDDAVPAIHAAEDAFTSFINTDENAPPDLKGKPVQTAFAEIERTEDEERERLGQIYGPAMVRKLFGEPIARISDEIAVTKRESRPSIAMPSPEPKTQTLSLPPKRTMHGREVPAAA